MNYIIESNSSPSIDQVGNKALNLIKLKKVSVAKVPEFFILTISAYLETLKYNGTTKPIFFTKRDFIFPPKIKKEIYNLLKNKFKNKKLVIRSSAILEDTPFLTFAGQFSSFLGIKGIGNIIEAIRKCYNSLLSENAKIYSKVHNLQIRDLSTAIIIQELAPVSISGILFTADPVFGHKEKIFVESVKGLGDNLTSGKKITSYLEIDKKIKNNTLFLEKLRTLAIGVEKIFGDPRDIEWGYDSKNKQFYLFQSRPVVFGNIKKYLPKVTIQGKKIICKGKVVSRGEANGKLKVVRGISDLKNVKKDEIIYISTKNISNKFIGAMSLSKGLLFQGGTLSHFAVIMRELKKPCLTGLDNTKSLIKHDTQQITLIAEKKTGSIYPS